MRTNLYWLASGLGLGIGCIWSVFPLPDLVKNFADALTEILIGLIILIFVLMAMRKSLKGGLWLVVVGIGAIILEYYISHYMFLALLIGIPTIIVGGLFILSYRNLNKSNSDPDVSSGDQIGNNPIRPSPFGKRGCP